jgi:hypothetical protein
MTLFKNHVLGKTFLDAYKSNQYDKVCKMLHTMLSDYEKECYANINRDDQLILDDTVRAILFIFSQQKFKIPNEHIVKTIIAGHLIANLVALSSYRTTDGVLRHISNQKDNLAKILCLYSCRNEPIFKQDIFFNLNPKLATIWWFTYPSAACGSPSKLIQDNLSRHYGSIPENFKMVFNTVAPAYFEASYTMVQKDKVIKEVLNAQCRALTPALPAIKETDPNSIVIITGRWYPTSAVYRSCAPYIKVLCEKYDVTLIHTGPEEPNLERTGFKKVICTGTIMNYDSFKNLKYRLAFFPDVGMSNESVVLANLRLAPIMVTGYGHPVSTFGSLIDYFIGGQETEVAEKAFENYSEKLVLIPGLGAHPVFPKYERNNKPKNGLILNCAWTSSKINYAMLCTIKRIIDRAGASVRLLPSWTIGRYNSIIPCVQDLNKIFGDEFKLTPELPYNEYLAKLEEGSLTLDSYPFGGYNTIVDSMFVGVPPIALEGTRFYNKASSALLRRVGLDSLITHNIDEYVNTAVEYLTNPQMMEEVREKLNLETLKDKLFYSGEEKYFVKAIDFLMENHEAIQKCGNPGPFFIEKD